MLHEAVHHCTLVLTPLYRGVRLCRTIVGPHVPETYCRVLGEALPYESGTSVAISRRTTVLQVRGGRLLFLRCPCIMCDEVWGLNALLTLLAALRLYASRCLHITSRATRDLRLRTFALHLFDMCRQRTIAPTFSFILLEPLIRTSF